MKNIQIIFFILFLIINIGCEEEENNISIHLELVSSETFKIINTEFEIQVYGYDSSFQDVPATLIARRKFKSTQLPFALSMEIPKNAVELIEHINHENNAKFFLYIDWDSDNNGIICNGDISVDYSNNFQNISIDTSKVQPINLVAIKSTQCRVQSYIKHLILPIIPHPYKGEYYIHADFTNLFSLERKELYYNASEHQSSRTCTDGIGMTGRGFSYTDTTAHESLEICFYTNDDTHEAFNYRCANYNFARPWNNVAGANIEFQTPVKKSEPYKSYRYLGAVGPECYFEIRYIDNNRLNGVFKTIWNDCCGGTIVYDVVGDFSIPRL
jgi:hypothetical protein